jgi:hypothetical protein
MGKDPSPFWFSEKKWPRLQTFGQTFVVPVIILPTGFHVIIYIVQMSYKTLDGKYVVRRTTATSYYCNVVMSKKIVFAAPHQTAITHHSKDLRLSIQSILFTKTIMMLLRMSLRWWTLIGYSSLLLLLASPSAAFAPAPFRVHSSTTLFDVASVPKDDGSGVSYSERSRPYRRDVFAYDDWVRHRSAERFTGRLPKLFKSGIARALAYEVQLLTAVAAFICVFNALCVAGYDDFSGIHYDPLINIGLPVLALPSMFFTLSSPALSLLLGTLFEQ